MRKLKDLTNQVFDRLTVLHRDGDKLSGGSIVWVCRCLCNNLVSVPSRDLISGNTKSCGCLNADKAKSIALHNEQYLTIDGAFIPILQKKVQENSVTGIKGVSVHKVKNKKDRYMANITIKGERHYLGVFSKLNDAIAARKAAEEKYFQPYIDKHNERKGNKNE
jgi:hypothetical protein